MGAPEPSRKKGEDQKKAGKNDAEPRERKYPDNPHIWMKELQKWCVEHRNDKDAEYEPRGRVGYQKGCSVFEQTIEMKPFAKRFSKRFENEIKYFDKYSKGTDPSAEEPPKNKGEGQYACCTGNVLPLEL